MSTEEDTEDDTERKGDRAFASVFRTGITKDPSAFLQAYLCTGSVKTAAKLSEVNRERHYAWMRSALYIECFREAQRQAGIALEEEARRRAIDAVLEPVFGGVGKGVSGLIGYRRRFSDMLLMRLLEANAPEKFVRLTEKTKTGPDVKFIIVNNGRSVQDDGTTVVLPAKEPLPDDGDGVTVILPSNGRETTQ